MSVCTRVSNFKKYHFKEKTFAKESDTFNELLANKTFLIEISRFIALQKVNWLEKFHCLADKGNVWKKNPNSWAIFYITTCNKHYKLVNVS